MFSFRELYFLLVGLFDWGYARMQFLSVSRNQSGFTLDTKMENLLSTKAETRIPDNHYP